MKKKALVVGIIFLFIGIAIAPSVTSIEFSKTKTSNSDDLVEITVELCKTDGIEEHQIFITEEQGEELENLFQGFKEDLDNAKSRKETVRLYSDMVVLLDEIGLLPESSSCEEVQQLVTSEKSLSSPEKIKSRKYLNMVFERFKDKNSKQHFLKNSFCQISARTTETILQSLVWTIVANFPMTILFLFLLLPFSFILSMQNPYPFGYTLGLGLYWEINGYFGYEPSSGWINTDGDDGKQEFEGEGFYGNLPMSKIYFGTSGFYPGITGFTGIRYKPNWTDPFLCYIVGKALWVKIGPNPY